MPDASPKLVASQHFRSDTLELKVIRDWLRVILQQRDLENCIDDAILAINEACMNIIQHAYYGQSDGKIIIELFQNANFLIFHLTDFAPPVDINKCHPRNLDELRPGGLGLHIIRSIMDEVQYLPAPDKAGNLLELKLNIHKQCGHG